MKNTVKKILALVFVVAMVCSLAVPAFAADDDISVYVTVVGRDGDVLVEGQKVTLSARNQNVEKALKDSAISKYVTVSTTTGKVTYLEGVKVTDKSIVGEFGTGEVVVALNGKAVSEDLGTVAVEKNAEIVVYWADSTLGTKLALVDDSNIEMGIVSLFYYDAEGTAQPLVGANITLRSATLKEVLRDKTNEVNTVENADVKYSYEYYFTTDEKGQIWIAPEYLDSADVFTIELPIANTSEGDTTGTDKTATSILADIDFDEDDYTDEEVAYLNANIQRNVEDVLVLGYEVEVASDMYNEAGATGDMTMVYVLVAAAAVVTLAAVVVMKKKAVKAN